MLKRLTDSERWQIKGAQYAWLLKKARAPVATIRVHKKLNTDRRKHLVITVANILRTGNPTPFAFESSCRHGVRSGLCLDGWSWREADQAATEVVEAALKRIGGTRPTWWQGQPESAAEGLTFIERTFCECCGGKMPKAEEIQTGWEKRYCSKLCNEKSRIRYERQYGKQRTLAELHIAQKAMGERKRQKRETSCRKCGELFIPFQNSRLLYCSRTCAGLAHRGRRVPLPKCVTCGKECKQTRTKYCSKECFRATIAAPTKPCEICGTIFRPQNKTVVTCSRLCGYKLQVVRRSRLMCEAA